MLEIKISKEFNDKWPLTTIGSVSCDVDVFESKEELKEEIYDVSENIRKNLKVEDISTFPPIREGRKAYKKLGKDPARYRLSSEALLRRIVKGKELYLVNNIVDINNLISLKSYFPICAFDIEKVEPPVQFIIGTKDDEYFGIGRGKLNVENLPVFEDQKGKIGSPTSDSERVKITHETSSISVNIISFNGESELKIYTALLIKYLVKYASARNIEKEII